MTFLKFFVIWCVLYTIADLIYWAYYYIKKYLKRQEYQDNFKITLSQQTSKMIYSDKIDVVVDKPIFKTLSPEMFRSTFEHITQKAGEIYGTDKFSNGRRDAYSEVSNIIKQDFIARENDFYRWTPNMFDHILNRIIRNAEIAVDKAYYEQDNFLKGRASAYLEILHVISIDFVRYGIDLNAYGLIKFHDTIT